MGSPVETLAGIRLSLASVDQFCDVASSLADDNPEIKADVWAAAKEARSAARLIDHLRSLFSHQHSIEAQAAAAAALTAPIMVKKSGAFHEAGQPKSKLQAAADEPTCLAGGRSSLLFTRSNQLNLHRASKSLVANIAKILYLTDSVLLPAGGSAGAEQHQVRHQEQQQHNERTNRSQAAPVADNVANFSQLLRSFGELAGQLVDLGACIALSQLHSAPTGSAPAEAPVWNQSAAGRVEKPHLEPNLLLDPELEVDPDLTADGALLQRERSLQGQMHDMQILFQVNRLIIERSILLLLSASKCCLRRGPECLRGFDCRRSIVGQIRASISIIMAIVKCSVFSSWPSGLQSQANDLSTSCSDPPATSHWPLPSSTVDGLGGATSWADGDSSLQIMNYFLKSCNGAQSAHDAISKLQSVVQSLARVPNYKCLIQALNVMFQRAQRQPAPDGGRGENNKENSRQLSSSNPLPGRAAPQVIPVQPLSSHQAQPMQEANFMLMNKRQLMGTLQTILLTDIKSALVERAHEFTDCAYTKHEHRETVLILLYCIKLQLAKLVKLIYRLRRRSSTVELELCLGQLRHLAGQLDCNCAELEHQLQTIVIEQSDELDRCNAQLDLVKQLKHFCLVGDTKKCAQACAQFQEQAEHLVEACRMLNQVAPTNKMKITTKSLAIWFELNWPQLIGLARSLSEMPQSRVLKDCAWTYLQVWCSFYDDFCQMARQIAYLTHASFDRKRHTWVETMRHQVEAQRGLHRSSWSASHQHRQHRDSCGEPSSESVEPAGQQLELEDDALLDDELASCWPRHSADEPRHPGTGEPLPGPGADRVQSAGALAHATSFQSLNLEHHWAGSETDSPRSLDHYQGFGANYWRHQAHARHQGARRSPVPVQPCAADYSATAPGYQYEAPAEPPAPVRHQLRFAAEPEVHQVAPRQSEEEASAEKAEQQQQSGAAESDTEAAGEQGSQTTETDKWSDSEADAIVRGARETAQMALSMYQFTRGEGDLNTTQDLFTQAELFAEEANELYKEVRCFSYKVPAGELKKELLSQLSSIPALVQQLQFIVKNPTVGKPATFAKVDSVIRETRQLMEAVNRVVSATLSCRQHYNMAIASMRKRTRTLSPSYRHDKGFEFDNHSCSRQAGLAASRHAGQTMGSEPDI